MTEKRFRVQEHCLRSSYGIEAENWLVTNDNHIVVLNNKAEAHMVANMCNDIIDVLNEQHEQINTLRESRRELISANNDYRMRETELAQELSTLADENEQLKQKIKEIQKEKEINCNNCQYFVSDCVSSDCLKREDIGYKGTCIDGMNLHLLALGCPYYD